MIKKIMKHAKQGTLLILDLVTFIERFFYKH